jgi:hypothetical protein
VTVTATNTAGNASATSAGVGPVTAAYSASFQFNDARNSQYIAILEDI